MRRREFLRLIGGVAVLAFLLGGVECMVGGGDQPVGIGPNLPGLLRDPDRHCDRGVRAGAALSIAAAQIEHPPRDDALSRKVDDGRTMQNSSPPVRTRKSPGRSRVDTMRVRCCRPTPVAANPRG